MSPKLHGGHVAKTLGLIEDYGHKGDIIERRTNKLRRQLLAYKRPIAFAAEENLCLVAYLTAANEQSIESFIRIL